ncbi:MULTISPECIES: DUF6522 family protein [Azospirillum]|uniref:DUF6522 family protein n=1 Tax=Azospirillum brasilense TaxID=192 RepID=A0ABU4PII9_AZOBR|nr:MULTISPECIES: DUF6522 family protein [Azospirillum]ALJ39470.1 hypothetical protein AMK58_28685 [Azospirillum brasilense]MDX5955906.1 DUF6522 family protein [Azospirillum brasilense]NUB15902.1 hypothetical protein [Azospirillum brasilense]PWC83936.1 hypothetical protein AEJ54_30190 [Azospirillum sp. Sp 7]
MTETQPQPAALLGTQVAEVDGAGDLVFDAAIVGSLLGLEPGAFMEELKKGMVHQVHEQGTGVDHGRRRVTFCYRARQSVLVLDAQGHALHVA